MAVDLFDAKASIIASFAGGPGIMIADTTDRTDRLLQMLACMEMESDEVRTNASVSNINDAKSPKLPRGVIDVTTEKVKWSPLIDALRAHPGKDVSIHYPRWQTVVATASRTRATYDGITVITERDTKGDGGTVVLRAR